MTPRRLVALVLVALVYVILIHVAALEGVLHHFQLWGRQ